MPNMMVFAAMPTESVSTTNRTKNGAFVNRRSAYRQSCHTVSMLPAFDVSSSFFVLRTSNFVL
jgi:hypothetical protein